MTPLNSQSKIEVTLVGLIATFVDPENTTCTAGVLRDTPGGHALDITVNKKDDSGVFREFKVINEADVADNLEIRVENTSTLGVSRREEPINRREGPTPSNRDSFLWVVDFERDLYPKQAIGARRAGFRPTLTMNNGELVARRLSVNELIIRRGPDGPEERFGTVATRAGIDIVLDQPKSRAIFTNGDEVIFEADNQSSFQIIINRGCSQTGGSDADSYYTALGDRVPDAQKIFFTATPFPSDEGEPAEPGDPPTPLALPADPNAACFNGHMSTSQPTD
jgi:hypothetical protein